MVSSVLSKSLKLSEMQLASRLMKKKMQFAGETHPTITRWAVVVCGSVSARIVSHLRYTEEARLWRFGLWHWCNFLFWERLKEHLTALFSPLSWWHWSLCRYSLCLFVLCEDVEMTRGGMNSAFVCLFVYFFTLSGIYSCMSSNF